MPEPIFLLRVRGESEISSSGSSSNWERGVRGPGRESRLVGCEVGILGSGEGGRSAVDVGYVCLGADGCTWWRCEGKEGGGFGLRI